MLNLDRKSCRAIPNNTKCIWHVIQSSYKFARSVCISFQYIGMNHEYFKTDYARLMALYDACFLSSLFMENIL